MVGRIPDCVPNASTLCLFSHNATNIQYAPSNTDAWTVPLIQNTEGVWTPVQETHERGSTATVTFSGAASVLHSRGRV